MNCPVCNRNNAFNLSICPSCGAMMNDSVREELLSKVSISKTLKVEKMETIEKSPVSGKSNPPSAVAKEKMNQTPPADTVAAPKKHTTVSVAAAASVKSDTSELASKPTSPTLVEFHSKNSSVPEWRLQLQNAVRQRNDRVGNSPPKNSDVPVAAAPPKTKLASSGANALKAEVVEEKKPAPVKNPTLSSALERIEKSRQKFLVEEEELSIAPVVSAAEVIAAPKPASKNFPFYIASKQAEVATKIAEPNAPPVNSAAAKPKLAASSRTGNGDLDTNKLPPLPPPSPQPAKVSTSFAKTPVSAPEVKIKVGEQKKIEIKPIKNEEILPAEAEIHEEFEDCAPVSMRFNAGLFDLIIGAFLSLLLLSPFVLTGGNWLTFTGVLAFLATCSIVMFIYLTATIGFYGRTFGMRLFSLEVVDIEGEHYPTLHQAAVSSAVYILSLALGGVGFLTLPFNEEKRAVHDLVSGTIVVKEG